MGERPNGLGSLGLTAPSSQPPKVDAAIVGAVRLLSVLIAALTMDLAGRKALLFVSGECRRSPVLPSFAPPAAALVVGAPGGPGSQLPYRVDSVCPAPGAGLDIQKGRLGLARVNEPAVTHARWA